MIAAYTFLALVVIGVSVGGWLHNADVGLDMFVQSMLWNDPIGVTISSRAGLAARNGKPLGANIVNAIMFNPQHCEIAIAADILRAQKALALLTGQST